MNVIDLRDELYQRRIDIIGIEDDAVYYAEELNESGENRIYIYSYDFSTEEERVLSSFELEGTDFLEHFYLCGDSIIILFENDTSTVWLIKLHKRSGSELQRKKLSLIGRFFDCVPIDDNDLIIYTKSDEEHKTLFNRCFETTDSEVLANLYDLSAGYRYFIKDFKTAGLISRGMKTFVNAHGVEKLLLCDPYCEESKKEELVRTLAPQLEQTHDELRDNIWVVSKERLLRMMKTGAEKINLRRAASAGLEGTVRFESVCGDDIVFRAKVYKSQLEQFFGMSASTGKVTPLKDVRSRREGGSYYVDEVSGRIYYRKELEERIRLLGEIGSSADIVFPEKIGDIEAVIEDRYIIADKSSSKPYTAIFDGKKNIADFFQARAKIKGRTVILY